MPRTWSKEQKEIMAQKMKERWDKRRSKTETTETKDELAEVDQQLNPVSNEALPEVVNVPALPPAHRRIKPVQVEVTEEVFSTTSLIHELQTIPLASVSYADCGLLLNALAAASTAVAQARRQKQEQLEAGTHRAPCKTCGRMIDISKPGGFQILTERDEHWMPKNSYYCSQNCLLARNMPSHAKQTPREKRLNQA